VLGAVWEGLGCLGLSQSQSTVAAKAVEMRRKRVRSSGPSFFVLASIAAGLGV
jgi:hypothetical protein